MLPRAILAFFVLPGTVALVVPIVSVVSDGSDRPFSLVGVIPIVFGSVLLLWCVRDFYVARTGTLAPWAPPEKLVEIGLYRFSSNPMYVAVLVVLSGWLLGFQTWP